MDEQPDEKNTSEKYIPNELLSLTAVDCCCPGVYMFRSPDAHVQFHYVNYDGVIVSTHYLWIVARRPIL